MSQMRRLIPTLIARTRHSTQRRAWIPARLLLVLFAGLNVAAVVRAQDAPMQPTSNETCANVRYLIANNTVPYALDLGGGVLQPGQPITSAFREGSYADFWTFNVQRTTNEFGTIQPATLVLDFGSVDGSLDLEAAVFRQMDPVADDTGVPGFLPVTTGSQRSYTFNDDAVYTLVVRRVQVEDQQAGSYRFTPQFNGGGAVVLENVRDDSAGSLLTQPPQVIDGREVITLPGAQIEAHPATTIQVASFGGERVQVRYGVPGNNFGVLLNGWADAVYLLGGDLAAAGDPSLSAEERRVFYMQDYGYRFNMRDGDLLNVVDSNGTRLALSWDILRGVWITRECAGFRLADGRTFTGIIDPAARDITFQGTADDFTIRLVSFDSAGEALPHSIDLGWPGIAAGSQTTLAGGVFTADLDGERRIALESTAITLRRQPDLADPALPPENIPLAVTLDDRGASLLVDWLDLRRLSLVGDTLELAFIAAPRDVTTRSAVDLLRVEALQNVIQIVYKEEANGSPGEERLLLPASEGYVEIITPAGLPAFNGRALPGEPGYSPRALNNTGGECYPVNTALPEANCPPNGHPNPANGNLWYAVTDHVAYGGLLDLTLTRSYNSAYRAVDGPFGMGWTSAYLLDYNVAFDAASNSRPITPEAYSAYPVGLDLTYAPRGLVTFITPSGSRHLFASADPDTPGGDLVALTMPGWILSRSSLRDPWTLTQDTGLVYRFDRAGRLISLGYPAQERVVTVDYPRDNLNGPAALGETQPVLITDAASERRLELYYDSAHRITRSVLREMRGQDAASVQTATCESTANCFETRYSYDDAGHLTAITYADGQSAVYVYDEAGRIIAHDDPLAPVAAQMSYTYQEDGVLCIDAPGLQNTNGDPAGDLATCNWQRLSPPTFNTTDPNEATTRTVSLRDMFGATTTTTYTLEDGGDLREVGATFTLAQVLNPLAALDEFEEEPQAYVWEDGLLVREPPRQIVGDVGRNSVSYAYTPSGVLAQVRGGYPTFTASFTRVDGGQMPPRFLPQTLSYADGSGEAFTYDENGVLTSMTDRDGGVYDYSWDAQQRISRVVSRGDSTVTTYDYDALGQVSAVTRYAQGEPLTSRYTVSYRYDGLGRLVGVDDPLTGTYSIAYSSTVPENSAPQTVIRVTDVTGAVTLSRFDGRGRLVETRHWYGENPDLYLRRTTYTYDVTGRLTGETRWLRPDEDAPPGLEPQPLTTRYRYRRVQSLRSLQGDDTTANLFFSGYAVDRIDPLGRTSSITYDSLGRVREIEDAFGLLTRYNYAVRDSGSINGLRISERPAQGGRVIDSIDYLFDFRWQLREVTRDDRTWSIFYDGNATRLRGLEAPDAGIAFQGWLDYAGPRPTAIDVNQTPDALTDPALAATYDFRGRPLVVVEGAGTEAVRYRVAYCPIEGGGERVVYSAEPVTAESIDLCGAPRFDRAMTYDAAGRVISVAEPGIGTRRYAYVVSGGGWRVTVSFEAADAANDAAWTLVYNSAGDLLAWEDANGITREYGYDTLGRLVRVTVPDTPEASFSFTYNEGDLLTSEVDDLGRGFTYVYTDRGQLAVAQDERTGDATIYGYNAAGQLSSVISPLGNTTTFLYDERGRLIGINEPTGSQQRFTWDNDAQTLTTTDPGGGTTAYTFDSFGALWRITDAAGRVHTLDYDSAGRLTGWNQTTAGFETAPPRRLAFTYPEPDRFTLTETSGTASWTRTFAQNIAGQLVAQAYADGEAAMTLGYDPLGRLTGISTGGRDWVLAHATGQPVLRVVDGFGGLSSLSFDALNRLVAEANPEGTTEFTYAVNGSQTDLSTGDGQVLSFTAGDAAGRQPAVIRRGPGQRVTYLYNADGLLAEIVTERCLGFDPAVDLSDPARPDRCVDSAPDQVRRTSERFLYDAVGRPTRYIDPADNIATFAYDDNGNLVNYQNVQGQSFTYVYDALNRLTSLTGPTGIRLILRYDDADQVNGICQDRAGSGRDYAACAENGGELAAFTYDALGRLLGQQYPNNDGSTSVDYAYDTPVRLLSGWRVGDEAGVAFVYDELGRVTQMQTTGGVYNVGYDDAGRLARVTQNPDFSGGGSLLDESYTYDNSGRLATLTAGIHTLTYTYDADGHGYRVRDENTRTGLAFRTDERGLLTTIDYLIDGVAETEQRIDVTFDYFLNPDRRVVTVQVSWSSGELIELQIDRNGDTLSVAYVESNLFVDFISDAVGQVQRESLIGSPEFFAFESNGYIVQAGYDNDNRPLTLRVTDRSNGDLLYLLSFTYDARGRRISETRQYGDGTQTTITYHYEANLSQLTRRDVTITRPRGNGPGGLAALPVRSLPVMLMAGGGLWVLRTARRRRLAAATGVTGLAAALALTFSGAQVVGDSFSFLYTYDARGNLATVVLETPPDDARTTCREYSYDSANRLTRVALLDGDTLVTQAYDYDATNRLARVGTDQRLAYAGSSETPMAAFEGQQATFYGTVEGSPSFFQAERRRLVWLLSDGRDSILATVIGTRSADPVWLLDPLGRVLPLESPPTDARAATRCNDLERFITTDANGEFTDTLADLRALAPPQLLRDDAVWDAFANLYFIDGRAYWPQIGRFLQRDPLGPDVFGSVYDYPYRQYAPPVRPQTAAYASGLTQFAGALERIAVSEQQSAADVLARFLPQRALAEIEPLGAHLAATAALTRDELARQMDFPLWLLRQYNLPGPYLDDGGALRLLPDTAPGQGGRPGQLSLRTASAFAPQVMTVPQIAGPLDTLAALLDRRSIPNAPATPYTSYQPFAWVPERVPLHAAFHTTHLMERPHIDRDQTPSAVLAWLPRPLAAPQEAIVALDAIARALDLPGYAPQQWVTEALATALPTPPDLPPVDASAWLRRWFTDDTLGTRDRLADLWPDLPLPEVPVYRIGQP